VTKLLHENQRKITDASHQSKYILNSLGLKTQDQVSNGKSKTKTKTINLKTKTRPRE